MGFKNDKRMFEYYAQMRVYCPVCGHSNTMTKLKDVKICTWCGNKVYRDKEAEFKDKLRIARLKEKKDEK